MKRGLFSMDKPFELHPFAAKIDKQSYRCTRGFQFIEQLRLIERIILFGNL